MAVPVIEARKTAIAVKKLEGFMGFDIQCNWLKGLIPIPNRGYSDEPDRTNHQSATNENHQKHVRPIELPTVDLHVTGTGTIMNTFYKTSSLE